jgi:uncharacterized protein (DUF2141 family)
VKSLKFTIYIFCISFLLQNCARKGTPSGGPKDEDAPIMVTAKPAHESINFKDDNIRIYFDEYIVLKDLNKKLIISPPFKTPALITPQGTPSKYINIKILDTLKENTTYTFNFGDAVQDNNENNKIENFKYVFSTGKYIDSLVMEGSVIDALKDKKAKNYNILLYKVDSAYTDSIVFKRKPDYVTKTLDSVSFKFTNIKEGKYRLFALEEETSNYIFNSKSDKIAFLDKEINLPKDSILKEPMVVFFQDQPFEFKRGREEKKGIIKFHFNGKQTDLKVRLLSKVPQDFKSFTKINRTKDSLIYWHTPVDLDSLNFVVSNGLSIDSVKVTLRKKQIDSLSIRTNIKNSNIHLKDTLKIFTNTPIDEIDQSKFSMTVSDSIPMDFKIAKLNFNELGFLFNMKNTTKYRLNILPKAISDIYQVQSKDTLKYFFITKQTEDYGAITVDVKKETDKPVILQLLHQDKVVKSVYLNSSEKVEFNLLEPKEYNIRAIIDANENGVWDTGNYLEKKQPEKVINHKSDEEKLILRANWILPISFEVK